jgi:hypothetical protein
VQLRTQDLPPLPWRYAITPKLVHNLTRVADAAGQMRAAPLSYYRQKEVAARAKRMRILWNVSGLHRSVKPEEVEAVLRGARLVGKRRPTGDAIERAALVEDALAHYTAFTVDDRRLTPEVTMAYHFCSSEIPGIQRPRRATIRTMPNWKLFSPRERAKLLDLQREQSPVPPEVKAIFEWVDQDPLASKSAVLRAATVYWAMTRLIPSWQSASVLLHHELRVGGIDANGLLMLTEATVAQHELLNIPACRTGGAEAGVLTTYFEEFSSALLSVLWERLEQLGRVQNNEAHLPWKVVAPPDELDARLYEVIERLGQAGSAVILEALGAGAPPLRTVQRRLQRLVGDGVLTKRGGRKNAVYAVAGRETE